MRGSVPQRARGWSRTIRETAVRALAMAPVGESESVRPRSHVSRGTVAGTAMLSWAGAMAASTLAVLLLAALGWAIGAIP
jgi:hypothetical protein